jgi:UDPglucose 6-dehydrogenase
VKVVIAGYGPVGQAVKYVLEKRKGLDIYIDDPAKGYNYYRGLDALAQIPNGCTPDPIDAVVVCVATPMREDGSCNTDHVEEVFDKYGATKYLIKSAVDPVWIDWEAGVREGSFTVSPEFLGSSNINRNTLEEFERQTYAIYGGHDPRFWDELFKPVLPELKEVKYCSLQQAAFAKYVENTFLATKVAFFNEMYQIYKDLGFEGFDQMVDAITIDPRIGRSHTQVPGPDGKFGFGGHCLPKDMAALRHVSIHSPLLDAIVDINKEHRND